MAEILRTRFPKGVVAEFVAPTRQTGAAKVIILCTGMPVNSPSKKELLEFFSSHGFWTFAPRYRGTWESAGEFLKESPEKDIQIVLKALPQGVRDLWSGEVHKIKPAKIFVLGTSFGAPAAFFLSKHPQVAKVVAVSPVVDWRIPSPAEPWKQLTKYIRQGFGLTYRLNSKNWKNLIAGRFYNPATVPERVDGSKVLIVHAKDDKTILWRPVKEFAEKIGAKMILVSKGGHGSRMLTPALRRQILMFLG